MRIIEEKLGIKIDDELYEKGRLVVYDKKLNINRFTEGRIEVERVELRLAPPVVVVA